MTSRDRFLSRSQKKTIQVASVVRICTSSNAVMPLLKRNLAAVPEEAQKRAARAVKR
jgi:hypothetical protein